MLIEPINTRDIPRFFLNRQEQAHQEFDPAPSLNEAAGELSSCGVAVNNDFTAVDKFTKDAGGVATVFVKNFYLSPGPLRIRNEKYATKNTVRLYLIRIAAVNRLGTELGGSSNWAES